MKSDTFEVLGVEQMLMESAMRAIDKVGFKPVPDDPESVEWHCPVCHNEFYSSDDKPHCVVCYFTNCKLGPHPATLRENERINNQE